MATSNECWMDLHRLASSLNAEGFTRQERYDNLTREFLAMPSLVRRELLMELRSLLANLPDLEPLLIQAANAAEEKMQSPGRVA
jgi:hypothetical protein